MEQIDIIKFNQNITLLGRTRQEVPFMFGVAGSDGLPFVYTEPQKLDRKKVMSLIKSSVDKRIYRGKVTRRDDGLIMFWAPNETAAQIMVAAFADGLLGQIPELERALVQLSS